MVKSWKTSLIHRVTMSKGAEYERCLSRICQSEAAFLQQKRPSKAQQFVRLIVFLGNRLSAWSNTLDIADILRCLNQIMEVCSWLS